MQSLTTATQVTTRLRGFVCGDVSRSRLLKDGVAIHDIGVVSLRSQTAKDAVQNATALGRHTFVHADADDMAGRLVADSFLLWKGLERPVIVVADVAPTLGEFGTRMRIALTRALTAARVLAPPLASGENWTGVPVR